MRHIRKALCVFLCGLFLSVGVQASEVTAEGCIRKMIAYYFHYRDQAAGEIEHQLAVLDELDLQQGQIWQDIMDSWAWANEEMTVSVDVLPEGLPTDDSLCIVVLGYGLNGDGSMKPELVERLQVALGSAEKYPEAYVLCTGGETARVSGISEAGQMGTWLLNQGLMKNRLILETKSRSTTENALNSCRILWKDYPQVKKLAVVSSDYHIRWGTVCFQTAALHGTGYQGKPALEIVGNAGWDTGDPDRDTMYSQAWGISIIADIPFDPNWVPELYIEEAEPTEETMPVPTVLPAPAAETAPQKEPVAPVLIGLAVALGGILLPRKKK